MGIGLLTFPLIFLALVLCYLWRKRRLSYFARLGIPGPSPHLITGNLSEIAEKGSLVCHQEWVDKYGKLVGFYFGGTPVLLAADPDFVKMVLVKDFQDFTHRTAILAGSFLPHKYVWDNLSMVNGQRWKITRNILSPIYSAARMKWMTLQIDDAVKLTAEIIKENAEKDQSFDILKIFQGMTLDITTRPNFGIRTNCQKDRNDPLMKSMLEVLSYRVRGPLMVFTACFPELGVITARLRILHDLLKYIVNKPSTEMLMKQCKDIVNWRKSEKQHPQPDMLKLMIEDKVTLEKLYGKMTEGEIKHIKEENRFMAPKEVWSNIAIMLMAGMETMSLTLSFTFRFLVHNQDIQDKAREEAMGVLKSEGVLSYEAANKLKYIEQVLNESLRIYPVVNGFVFREAVNDVHYGDLLIPKGTIIQVSLESLHRNPEFWDEPLKFNPERFQNKASIDPYIFQPFGTGPRHCLGKRFAELSLRVVLARLLTTFKFVPCEETPTVDGEVDYKLFQILPKYGVTIKAVPL